jgi:putative sterol carrier protein
MARRRPEQVLADSFARTVARSSPQQRALVLRGPQRRVLLAAIFKGMERQFDGKKGADLDAVLRWEIGRPGGGADRWQVVIAGGRVRAGRRLDREPRVTIKLDGERFLELVAGVVTGPELYMSGKVRIDGDVMFAAQLMGSFRMPKRARPS